MFRMVYKNLTGQFKKQRMLSLLLVLNIIVTCLVICFSYGLYQHYNMVSEKGEYQGAKELNILIDKEHCIVPGDKTDVRIALDISPSMIMEMMKSWSDETKDNLSSLHAEFLVETALSAKKENSYSTEEYYSDDQDPYYMAFGCFVDIEGDQFIDTSNASSYFTEEQYNSGEKIVALDEDLYNERKGHGVSDGIRLDGKIYKFEYSYRHVSADTDHILIGGESYKIIDKVISGTLAKDVIAMPLPSLPETARVEPMAAPENEDNNKTAKCLTMSFNEAVTRQQYKDINDSLIYLGGDAYLQDISFVEIREIYYYKTIMLISCVIAILAAINMAILYRYILEKRSSELAILRVCGCTKGKAVMTYLLECLIINAPLFALTELIYHKLIMPKLAEIFPNMTNAYSFKLYAAIFGIYVAASTLVMLVMIVFTIRKHSLVALKSATRATSKFGIMKIFEIVQLAAVFSMIILIVSAIASRYTLYAPFKQYFERQGYMVVAQGGSTYRDKFEEITGTSDMINCQANHRRFGDVYFNSVIYDDEFIEAYAPPLEEGVWLSDTDITYEKNGYIPAVITSCGGRYKVGDILSEDYEIYDRTVHCKIKIIGVLQDQVSIASLDPELPLRHDFLDMYNVFDDEFEDRDWLLTKNSDEYACFGTYGLMQGTQFVFYDDMSQGKKLNGGDFEATPLSVVRKNSMKYIYAQMYTLFPIALCIFILTVISTVSISAIYTKRQLRNYAIFYICGARWRTCALRSLKNSAITCGIAAAISALVLIVGKLTFLKETVISFGLWHLAVCAGVIILYLALSMIMPLMIIGSNEPKEVLKEE